MHETERPAFEDEHYCSVRHLPRFENCTTFSEVGALMVEVLAEMRSKYPPDTIFHQVCGPITTGPGTIHEKLMRFERAINYLRDKRLIVFNQLPPEAILGKLWKQWTDRSENEGKYCYPLLEGVYRPIFESRMINVPYFLPNWSLSKGSVWEHETTITLGLKIKYFPLDWDRDHPL